MSSGRLIPVRLHAYVIQQRWVSSLLYHINNIYLECQNMRKILYATGRGFMYKMFENK